DLIVSDDILAPWLFSVSARNHQVTDGIISRYAIEYFEVCNTPLDDLGREEHGCICIPFAVKFRMQRTQSRLLYFAVEDRFILHHRNSMVFSFHIVSGNGLFKFFE